MNNCKILLIDTPSDITLLKESIAHIQMPVDIQAVTSIASAMDAINAATPDIILIGSGKLMEDFEILTKVKDIPVVILCESDGFDLLLNNKENSNACISRLERFWRFARERLFGYKGTEQKYFILFLKELEFRYNHRNSEIFDVIVAKLS